MFGPEDDFFNRFAALARVLPFLPLIGGGHDEIPACLCGRCCRCDRALRFRRRTRCKTYELGGPNVYSFKELMQIVLRETCRTRFLVPLPFVLATIQACSCSSCPSRC